MQEVKPEVIQDKQAEVKTEVKQEIKPEVKPEIKEPAKEKNEPIVATVPLLEFQQEAIAINFKDYKEGTELNSLDQSNLEICKAIGNFIRPPGFENHESFTISFDINAYGKAINISPKGSEPLALYASIKELILKANYPINKAGIRVELIIE